jgi:hypothetical protein
MSSNARLPDDVLLEVFEQLSCLDIVRCQSVCRRWRDVISWGTPKIHRHLFLTKEEKDESTEAQRGQLYIDLDLNFREKPATPGTRLKSGQEMICHTFKCYHAPHAATRTFLPQHIRRLPLYDFGFGSRVPQLKLHPVIENMSQYTHLIDPRFASCKCSNHPNGPCLKISGTFWQYRKMGTRSLSPESTLNNAYISMPPLQTVWLSVSWLEVMMGSSTGVHQRNRERFLRYLADQGLNQRVGKGVAGGINLFGGASWYRIDDTDGVKVGTFLRVMQEEIEKALLSLEPVRGRSLDTTLVHCSLK